MPLCVLLSRRTLLEFPTIYVLGSAPDDLPKRFMLEMEFIARARELPLGDNGTKITRYIDSRTREGDEETSNSASQSDLSLEEGEIR